MNEAESDSAGWEQSSVLFRFHGETGEEPDPRADNLPAPRRQWDQRERNGTPASAVSFPAPPPNGKEAGGRESHGVFYVLALGRV